MFVRLSTLLTSSRASYLFDIGKAALWFQEVFMFSQLTAFFFRFIQVDSCSIFYFHCYHYHLTSSKMNMYHLTFYFRIATYYIHEFHCAFFLTRCTSQTHDILPNHRSYYSVMATCVRQKKGYFWLVLGVNKRKVLIIWIFTDKVKLYKDFQEKKFLTLVPL